MKFSIGNKIKIVNGNENIDSEGEILSPISNPETVYHIKITKSNSGCFKVGNIYQVSEFYLESLGE